MESFQMQEHSSKDPIETPTDDNITEPLIFDVKSHSYSQLETSSSDATLSNKLDYSQFFNIFFKVMGPGFVVAIGYMDPGNWATDLAGGSQYGYSLLSIILISNILAIILQSLCVSLGVITGKDLAQASMAHLHPALNIILYLFAEMAMIATDLAEIIGGAIALQLLTGLDLKYGILITSLDVLIILMFWTEKYQKYFEFFIFIIVMIVGVCFSILLNKTAPVWSQVGLGFIPTVKVFQDGKMLYIALAILGATVMPHNLYVHSHLVCDRNTKDDYEEHSELLGQDKLPFENISHTKQIFWRNLETAFALIFAVFINSSILIVAASSFHFNGEVEVGEINDAYNLLRDLLGHGYATIFAIALLLCAQASTLTGTMAGQIVMEGHLGQTFVTKPWVRRTITRLLAVIPAMVVAVYYGDSGVSDLLLLSQVMLSLQLPFAVWPLVYFTSSNQIMQKYSSLDGIKKSYANSWMMTIVGCCVALILSVLNLILFVQYFIGV